MSPVPDAAMGPVYHTCDIDGTMMPTAHQKANTAAMPGGSSLGLLKRERSYREKSRRRKIKCSVRMMVAKTADQYPMIPIEDTQIWCSKVIAPVRVTH